MDSPEKLYCLYKKRGQIEQIFDDYKNLLDLEPSYLGSDVSMETWLFLNHLGLMTCYRVYELLRSTQFLKKVFGWGCIAGVPFQYQDRQHNQLLAL